MQQLVDDSVGVGVLSLSQDWDDFSGGSELFFMFIYTLDFAEYNDFCS